MRILSRFERVPGDELENDQDIILSAYPQQTKPEIKNDTKGNYERMTQHEISDYAIHKSLIERLQDYERRTFGTQILSFLYTHLIAGWRAGLFRAFSLSSCALLLNISIYAWLFATSEIDKGSAIVTSRSCNTIHNMDIGIHAGLNIMSTLILSASRYAMQGMTAPTRADVDKAHSNGKWVEIGAQSWRNLAYVSKRNAFLWGVLALTSLPLHLIFNAVFFTTSQANQYAVAVIDEAFLTNVTVQPTAANASPSLFKQHKSTCDGRACDFNTHNDQAVVDLLLDVRESRDNISEFVYMNSQQCLETYSHGLMQLHSDVVVVVVVTSQPTSASPILWTRWPQRYLSKDREYTNDDSFHWVCHDTLTGQGSRCREGFPEDFAKLGKNWTVYNNVVDHCFVRLGKDECHLQFNVWLMLTVVVFGLIKVLAIAWIVFTGSGDKNRLRTLGDAIQSYLEKKDPITQNMSLVSSVQIRKEGLFNSFEPQVYNGARPRWYSAANTTEFFSTVGLSGVFAIMLSITLYFAIDGAKDAAFDPKLGTTNIQSLATFMRDDVGSSGIVPLLLVANVPQLAVSLLYVVYTGIWGKLAVTREFDNLAKSQKGLRVSNAPHGNQRSSHFLTLRIKYAVPLMACSAVLHWLCSQSLFLVRFDGITSNGKLDEKDRMVRLGYNVTGMLSLIGILIAMMVGTICVASFRRLKTPLGETCMSCVISAACHVMQDKPQPWREKLQWGVIGANEQNPFGGEEDRYSVRRCGFTAGEVQSLEKGERYQ